MKERFSDRARHAMALANQEAGRLGHDFIAPAHIMLGLIAEGQCVATEALRLLAVDLDSVREQVQALLQPGESNPTLGRRAQTEDTKKVIGEAIREARQFGHRYVGTEHLVLSLLAYEEGIPSKVLQRAGVEADRLRQQVLDLLSGSVDAAHDLAHSRHGELEWIHHQELAKAFRSPKFWQTMILAVDSANRAGAAQVEPEHLLIALLRDESTGASKLLQEKGVTLEWLGQRAATTASA